MVCGHMGPLTFTLNLGCRMGLEIGNGPIRLQLQNHKDWHSKFQLESCGAKIIRGQ